MEGGTKGSPGLQCQMGNRCGWFLKSHPPPQAGVAPPLSWRDSARTEQRLWVKRCSVPESSTEESSPAQAGVIECFLWSLADARSALGYQFWGCFSPGRGTECERCMLGLPEPQTLPRAPLAPQPHPALGEGWVSYSCRELVHAVASEVDRASWAAPKNDR